MTREDWIGDLPSDWKIARLGALGSLGKGSGGSKEDNRDSGVPVVRYGELYTKFDRIISDAFSFISPDDAHRYTPLPTGSLVFAGSGEDPEEIGKAALSLLSAPAFVGGDSVVFTPRTNKVDPVYLTYVLDSKPLRANKAIRSTGFTVVHINAGKLKTLPIPLPPRDEQRAIADYLDQETAQIDALVAKQEEFIELLRERRSTEITSAVTGRIRMSGSRHNEAHHPQADSGVGYLRAVPADWEVSRFGRHMIVTRGQVDPRLEPWSDMVLIAPNHIESGTGRITGRESARDQGADSGKYLVRQGQILYSKIRPALNKVAIASEDCLCSADMYAMSSFDSQDDPRYITYFMLSKPFHAFMTQLSMRVKMPKINRNELSSAPWLRPSATEQTQIANYLDDQTSRIDTLISKAEEHIALAKERRAALITAAVTGQFDVRTARKAA